MSKEVRGLDSNDENWYNRKPKDKEFHMRNFFLYYKDILRKFSTREEADIFRKNVISLGKKFEGIDFDSNLLFISNRDLSREVFMVGFSSLPNLTTHFMCDFMTLHDIWWGNRRENNPNIEPEDVLFSEGDIKQRVLCVYVDLNMYSMSTDRVLDSIIVARNNKSDLKGNPMRTWVFVHGTVERLKSEKGFSGIYQLFASEENNHKIIDMNIKDLGVVQSKSNASKGNSDLANIY